MNTDAARYFAVVPAAGSGSRMGGALPKQYLSLRGRPMLWHTLRSLLQVERLARVLVVLSPEDEHWALHDAHWADLQSSSQPGSRLQVLRIGGVTRADSVTHALQQLHGEAQPDDWVLVHDAARACIRAAQVVTMMDALSDDPVGGLLALPVADTLKRSDAAGRVQQTVPRDAMWQAQTPQMFRYGLLCTALAHAPEVTDEAGAIEALGHAPRLVPGEASNFKITYAQDLALAERILAAQDGATPVAENGKPI